MQAEDVVARLTGIAVQHARMQQGPPLGTPILQHLASSIRTHAPTHALHHDIASLRYARTTSTNHVLRDIPESSLRFPFIISLWFTCP